MSLYFVKILKQFVEIIGMWERNKEEINLYVR